MSKADIFTAIIATQMVCAGFVYLWFNKWGSAVYWLGIGVINFAVVFLIKKYG